MYAHGPACLEGPLSRDRSWWLAAPDEDVRTELIERVRREIAAGVYETEEKWLIALDRLLDRLEQA
jgi:hypothetical protein